MIYIIGVGIFAMGVIVGIGFPDIDSTLSFLVHRSIVTHNFIWPLMMLWGAKGNSTLETRTRLFSMGLSIALAVHFCFDLFPRSWIGYSLIHIPIFGRLETGLSWLWLALCILICVYIAISLIKQIFDIALLSGGSLIAFIIEGSAEPFVVPLVTFIVCIILVTGIDWAKIIKLLRR